MKKHHHTAYKGPISAKGFIAGAACALFPNLVIGLIVLRDAANQNPLPAALYTTLGFTIIFAALQFFVIKPEGDKYYAQRLAGDEAPPSAKFQTLHGAAIGMGLALIGMTAMLLWMRLQFSYV